MHCQWHFLTVLISPHVTQRSGLWIFASLSQHSPLLEHSPSQTNLVTGTVTSLQAMDARGAAHLNELKWPLQSLSSPASSLLFSSLFSSLLSPLSSLLFSSLWVATHGKSTNEVYILATHGEHGLVLASHLEPPVLGGIDATTSPHVSVVPLACDQGVDRLLVGFRCHASCLPKAIMKPF